MIDGKSFPLAVSLVKGLENFVFRYSPGNEAELIKKFTSMAENPNLNFDFSDAYILTRKVRIKMREYYKDIF